MILKFRIFMEDTRQQKQDFVYAVRSVYPDAEIESTSRGLQARIWHAERNIIIDWQPGLPYQQSTQIQLQKQHSYVKISFYNTGQFHIGDVKRGGVSDQALGFTRQLMRLMRNFKFYGIHVEFSATDMDRADSYAKMLQRTGYTLGNYADNIQLWLAKPVDNVLPKENPYLNKGEIALRKRQRALEPMPAAVTK